MQASGVSLEQVDALSARRFDGSGRNRRSTTRSATCEQPQDHFWDIPLALGPWLSFTDCSPCLRSRQCRHVGSLPHFRTRQTRVDGLNNHSAGSPVVGVQVVAESRELLNECDLGGRARKGGEPWRRCRSRSSCAMLRPRRCNQGIAAEAALMQAAGVRVAAIARHFGVDHHTVDKAIRWFRRR